MSKLLVSTTVQPISVGRVFAPLWAALVQPAATFGQLTASAYGQVWLPLGGALLAFYLHTFVLVALQSAALDWRFAGGVLNILVGWPLRMLLLAALTRLRQGRPAFGPLLWLSAWATLPLTLRSAGQTLYLLITGHPVAQPGLAGLLAGADTALPLVKLGYFVLGWIDLFTLWHLALLVLAVRIGAAVSMGKGCLIVMFYSIVIALLYTFLFFTLPNR